jgi:hypothetical protein
MRFKQLITAGFIISTLFSSNIYARIHGNIEFGASNIKAVTVFPDVQEKIEKSFRTKIYLKDTFLKVKQFSITAQGSYETFMIMHKVSSYEPYRDIYSVALRLQFHDIYCIVGHFCSHPVESAGPINFRTENSIIGVNSSIVVGVEF